MQQSFPKAVAVRTKEVDGQILVHDEKNRNIHVFNQTAGTILGLCDGSNSIDAIVETLAYDPDVPKEAIRRDVERMLKEFASRGLLE